jgi:hypothetical protein
VEYSLELCTASSGLGLGGGLFKLGFGTVTKANSKQMAADFINERIRKALAAAHISSSVVTALQVSMTDVGLRAKQSAHKLPAVQPPNLKVHTSSLLCSLNSLN